MRGDIRCDVFCAVVDNFGDIGVCWRLARQLVAEHGYAMRLWVDDLASFARLCPQIDATAPAQNVAGVEVQRWERTFAAGVTPAEVVVEAFACELPERYVAGMAARAVRPVWINLEYLSAEPWVDGCHAMASPHPRLPLIKHFFFPGFGPHSGGLLRERDLFARRDAFAADAYARAAFWRTAGFAPPSAEALVVSLFGYSNPAVGELLRAFADSDRPIVCALSDGPLLGEAVATFQRPDLRPGEQLSRGSLQLRAMPFVAQDRYDELLWASDLNFVRGEDSFVRAQWAARPLVWQIYPQAGDAHWAKLEAFRARYCDRLAPAAAQALSGLWRAWNRGDGVGSAWPAVVLCLPVLAAHSEAWCAGLAAQSDLASRLAEFCASRLQ